MNKYFQISINKLILVMLVISVVSGGCGGNKANYPNNPKGVTQQLFDSLQENDANKYLDSITPSDRQQPGYFFYRQLIQGIFGAVGLGQIEASKLKISFSDMVLKEISNDGTVAQVQVTGKLRDLNLALEQDFSTAITTIKVDGIWLCSLSDSTQASGDTQVFSNKGLLVKGFFGNEWLILPLASFVSNDSYSRAGYRRVGLTFSITNISNAIQRFDFGTSANNPSVVIQALDSRGYKYEFDYRSITSLPSGYPSIYLPPKYGIDVHAEGEVPDNASDITLQINSGSNVLDLPMASKLDEKIKGICFDDGATVDCYQKTYDEAYRDLEPLMKNWGRDLPSIGSTITVDDIADITLKSASFDKDNSSWTITISVRNQYGYDLFQDQCCFIELITDAHIGINDNSNGSNSGIPPSFEGEWVFTVPTTSDTVWEHNMIVIINRDRRDSLFTQNPIVYAIFKLNEGFYIK